MCQLPKEPHFIDLTIKHISRLIGVRGNKKGRGEERRGEIFLFLLNLNVSKMKKKQMDEGKVADLIILWGNDPMVVG